MQCDVRYVGKMRLRNFIYGLILMIDAKGARALPALAEYLPDFLRTATPSY